MTVGVPHAVIFEKSRLDSEDRYRKIGRAIRLRTDLFPEGANINFVTPKSTYDAGLEVLTYERGWKTSPFHAEQAPQRAQ